ncbi:hypothetical protein [Streptomyces spiralis]|uniref:hypothetical protein n=1 Tax=Streptomyces spiralis TaxID=66376 RepID=UPI0033DDBBD4
MTERETTTMPATNRRRCVRALAAGALSAALVSAGSAAALAADSAPPVRPSVTHSTTPMKPMATASITVKANHTSVKAGESVTLAGHAKDAKTGTKLVLQHMHNGKWTTLHANTTVKKGGVFKLTEKLHTKGTEHLRVSTSDGKTHSPTVTVKVH